MAGSYEQEASGDEKEDEVEEEEGEEGDEKQGAREIYTEEDIGNPGMKPRGLDEEEDVEMEERGNEEGSETWGESESDRDTVEAQGEWHDLWYDMVQEYSRRTLTLGMDRLPAMSGLAAHFQQKMKSQYIAGLWEDDLVRGLLWVTGATSGTRARPPLEYVAPSWSWASVSGCWFQYDHMKQDAAYGDVIEEGPNVEAIEQELKGVNPFGEVTSGKVILRGSVIPSRLSCSTVGGHEPKKDTLFTMDGQTRVGVLNADADTDECSDVPLWLLAMVFTKGNLEEKEAEEEDGTGQEGEMGEARGEQGILMVCLCLIKTGLASTNEYRRVGIAGVEPSWFSNVARTEVCIV